MRRKVLQLLARAFHWLTPKPDQSRTIDVLTSKLSELAAVAESNSPRAKYFEQLAELVEARQMAGAGPWRAGPGALAETDKVLAEAARRFDSGSRSLRETVPVVGAYGDIDLALQNVEWRREVSLSWLEFSRWGIQQIILIARLRYMKSPIIRRLVDVCAAYVFARGVSVSSENEQANRVIQDFLQRNKGTLGQNALCDLERRKDYDGNLFFVLFTDTQDSGRVTVRTIDATEIQEVVTDPDDTDTPRYYRRVWTQQVFDEAAGSTAQVEGQQWYPALGYEPANKPKTIGKYPVDWDSPVLHRKCGGIGKWHFGCPRMFPAGPWAAESEKYLASCASVAQALAQIALLFQTKGGQAAIAGAKEQLGTNVNVGGTNLWDTNPPAVSGSTFASGPGTTLQAFKTQGAGMDPEKVRQYKLMCCMVAGVPETFLGDVSTGNLATAASLDRPTETVFLEKQEAWREDLVALATYAVRASSRAPSGRLLEAARAVGGKLEVREAERVQLPDGKWKYSEAKNNQANVVEIRAEFPAIREGDLPTLIGATVEAMTLGTQEVCGIDEKEGVRKLYDLLGMERGDELVERQYPDEEYDPDRTQEPEPEETNPKPPGAPGTGPGAPKPRATESAATRLEGAVARLGRVLKVYEASRRVAR